MTHPPQPPGQPGPYGQPDPYGQQGQPGQPGQPGPYGQPGQPGGFPQSGPMPQQPGGYPGPQGPQQFGQQQFGQPVPGQPGFGEQGPGGEPPKKKTGLIVGLAVAAVAVIGGVIALILLLPGDDQDSQAQEGDQTQAGQSQQQRPGQSSDQAPAPGQDSQPSTGQDSGGVPPASGDDQAAVQELADKAFEALNNRDIDLAQEISCVQSSGGSFDDLPEGLEFSQRGEIVIDGSTAEIPMQATFQGQSKDGNFIAEKRDGRWCMSDIE